MLCFFEACLCLNFCQKSDNFTMFSTEEMGIIFSSDDLVPWWSLDNLRLERDWKDEFQAVVFIVKIRQFVCPANPPKLSFKSP